MPFIDDITFPLRASWHMGPLVSVILLFFTGEGYQPPAKPPTWRASGISLRLAPNP